MHCWFCGGQVYWSADFNFEDYGLEGEGVVAVLRCSECGADFEGYLRTDSEECDDE